MAQVIVSNAAEAKASADSLGFPLVMKVVGPLHKTDVGGVILNIRSATEAVEMFSKLMLINGAEAVLMQRQHDGVEIFLGAKADDAFGHLVLCGLGGIFVEVYKDVSAGLSPVSFEEAGSMIRHLKGYALIAGIKFLQ